jgi:hypothetical protein
MAQLPEKAQRHSVQQAPLNLCYSSVPTGMQLHVTLLLEAAQQLVAEQKPTTRGHASTFTQCCCSECALLR